MPPSPKWLDTVAVGEGTGSLDVISVMGLEDARPGQKVRGARDLGSHLGPHEWPRHKAPVKN